MRGSVVRHLILKDWRLQRGLMAITTAGGAIALAIAQFSGETRVVVGSVFFFIALIISASMLPIAGIVNERKKQNLAFLMSLPISSMQYTTAKLISNMTMFLIPWITLVISAVLIIETRGFIPRGAIPVVLILAFMPLLGFCLITGAALVGESEGWGIAATAVCNSSYGLLWYFVIRNPAINVNVTRPVPVWNSTVLTILASEFALVPLIFGLTYFLQSRKRDFV
jgi:ABC-2 type transport system permease protein